MSKLEKIKSKFKEKEEVAVMLSGGVDSTLLAKIAHNSIKNNTIAITLNSPVIPEEEIKEAKKIAKEIGIKHKVIDFNELEKSHLKENPPERCYTCRKIRDKKIKEIVNNEYNEIADGLNCTDLDDFRPGLKASTEDGIWHPFIEFQITKEEIREISKELELPTWDKPNMACLCSRFPYGFGLTKERLERVRKAEKLLRDLGYKEVRVRHFPYKQAYIEVSNPIEVMEEKDRIQKKLREIGFNYISLDLEGYKTGKMNRIVEDDVKEKLMNPDFKN